MSSPQFSHLFIHVKSLQDSRAFYVDTLGLQVLLEEPGYLRIGGGGGFHVGMEEMPEAVEAQGIEIEVRVPDVDEVFDRLSALGIAFETPPEDMPWGARHARLRDPSGHRLSIFTEL